MARPRKHSPEREQAIIAALRIGNTRVAACRSAEISHDTLARWLAADAAFSAAVQKAEADAEQRFLAQVAKAAQTTWQAAAWWLERRRHEDYAQRSKVEMSVDLKHEAGEIAAQFGDDSDALIAEAEAILAGRR